MRRQAAVGEVFAELNRAERLDPFVLPVSFAVPIAGRSPGATMSVTIDRKRAVLRRSAREGAMTLPISDYRGVAVRIKAAPPGDDPSVILELNHEDPDLSLPLMTADDPADVVADWQAWSRALGLPLLLIEADGSIARPEPQMGCVLIFKAKPRRRGAFFAGRRPRFLTRRKNGWDRDLGRVAGEEMIARD